MCGWVVTSETAGSFVDVRNHPISLCHRKPDLFFFNGAVRYVVEMVKSSKSVSEGFQVSWWVDSRASLKWMEIWSWRYWSYWCFRSQACGQFPDDRHYYWCIVIIMMKQHFHSQEVALMITRTKEIEISMDWCLFTSVSEQIQSVKIYLCGSDLSRMRWNVVVADVSVGTVGFEVSTSSVPRPLIVEARKHRSGNHFCRNI